MRAFVAVVLMLPILYLAVVLGLQRRVVYPRVGAPEAVPQVAGLDHWKVGPDEDVDAFFLPPTGPRAEGRQAALIFAHGNGEVIDMWANSFEQARAQGVAVLLVEYPGYGRSGGSPGEARIGQVFEAAYDRLVSRQDIDPARIVGYGRSLGGGAIGNLSRSRSLSALIFESSFSSTLPLAAGLFVPQALVLDRYDNARAVDEFEGRVLILHGKNDSLIPRHHAEELHERAAHSELHLMPCGHNDCPRRWDLIGAFLEEETSR
jgi:pimeloyl-ACP methyl ester carboxylesterase